MNRKLSERQVEALRALKDDPWRCAYPGLHLGTLNALALRKLVKAKHDLGSMLAPNVNIRWALTEEGQKALDAIR